MTLEVNNNCGLFTVCAIFQKFGQDCFEISRKVVLACQFDTYRTVTVDAKSGHAAGVGIAFARERVCYHKISLFVADSFFLG